MTTQQPVVSDSSPLIALNQIGLLHLLRDLFESIIVPPAVAAETAHTISLPSWIVERGLAKPIDERLNSVTLDPGEREALSLALEAGASWVVVDELPARKLAGRVGLPVLGTLGVLLRSKDIGLLSGKRSGTPCVSRVPTDRICANIPISPVIVTEAR